MTQELEKIILTLTLNDPEFSSRVNVHFKQEYFTTPETSLVADLYKGYLTRFNSLPTKESLTVELEDRKGVSQDTYKNTKVLLSDIFDDKKVTALRKMDKEFLFDKTEKYFVQQACQIAILKSLEILDGENKKLRPESIPDILKEAVNISFDNSVGHDYLEDAEERFEYYHKVESKIPFLLNAMDAITNGGARRKSLIVPVAPTGVGKSFFMTAWSSFLLRNQYNVLYITLEMAEEEIAKRIDANLFDITLDQLAIAPKSTFTSNINRLKSETTGKLIIKEFVSGTFGANHLRHLLKELKLKQNFVPDVVMVDYINLMASIKHTTASDTYSYIKSIAEELRGVAMEFGIVICSPTQTNRSGVNAADFSLTEISESMGIAHTADFMFGLIQNEELAKTEQMRIKQLKNRWGDISKPASFVINVSKAKMQMYDSDNIATKNVVNMKDHIVVAENPLNLDGALVKKTQKRKALKW